MSYAPDQIPIFSDVNLNISEKFTGIVGNNGSGKSTLLSLISRELEPVSGSIQAPIKIGYLKQSLCFSNYQTVSDVLGISDIRAAISRVESGSISEIDFDIVGNDWDVEDRALKIISARIPSLRCENIFDRPIRNLSGGEIIRLAFCGLKLSDAELILLDEPTNNLDIAGREALISEIQNFSGKIIAASHDRELLGHANEIIEIYEGDIRKYGGNYQLYKEQLETEQGAIHRHISDATKDFKEEKKVLSHVRYSSSQQEKRDKIKASPIKRKGKLKSVHSDPTLKRSAEARRANKIKAAVERVEFKKNKLEDIQRIAREENIIRIPIIEPKVKKSKQLLCLEFTDFNYIVGGGDRVAITGPNGAGKTTIVKNAINNAYKTKVGFIDQRLEMSDITVFESLKCVSPERSDHDVYEFLSKFLITGDVLHRKISTLSGGERFRVVLASTLFPSDPPEILVLDEPTNNLDITTVEQLISALSSYRGAILVISHDKSFLENIDIQTYLKIDNDVPER